MKLKIITTFFVLIALQLVGLAQPPEYDDLLIYFADGEYEKGLKKAEKYTLDDKTKKDAIPYLFLSKINYAISQDGNYAEDFPKAFKDAVKFATKCIKKDKDGSVSSEEMEYFKNLKAGILEELENYASIGVYNKMMSSISLLQRLDKQDVGSYFLKAGAYYQNKDKSGAKLSAKEAYLRLDALENVESWHKVDLSMLSLGVVEYCKAILGFSQVDKAKDLLGRVKQWLEDDEYFIEYYDSVVN